MKKIITELMATVLVVALLFFSGCGGVKDDPNIAEKEAKEGKNDGEGENEEPPDVDGDTIKFKPKSKDEEGDPDDDDDE